ncbi:hypothetical protein [Dolichospermum circinale]|uniref:hypothetical protein n=1 Tax=Dolichospermum circinale TaxID=109265 RepID=UPI00232DF38A|nr:hypothetical protein [Dolichospermum circinale]MDB9456577.1 hypothetical protein [Dolichospermum circinale CS-541/06]MDB9464386.1 hypothetical protein [Dolichospermum circinale CS-541/04]MDB9548673.1 hypothetical protein [Dolichospermum circinale CS-1031]
MNSKKHSVIPENNWRQFIYLGLSLTLPSLFLTTAVSINSASAADDIITENQNSESSIDKTAKATSVNDTKQVVTAAELEKTVPSVPEQKQPQLIAQTGDGNPDDVNKIRQDLLIEPLIKIKVAPPTKPTYPPGLSFAAPSAFGANMGDAFLGTSAAFFGTRDTELDGSISAGFGLGNSQKLIGLEFGFNNGSIKDFGSNGTFDFKAHRIVYAKGTNQIGVAGGWKTFAQYGNEGIRPSSAYGVVTSYSLLRPNNPGNKMPISFSAGAGGGDFRQGNASTGVFAGVGVQVHPQVGVGLGWSGVGFNIGASFVPIPTLPLTITATGSDLTDNSPGGTVFSLSLGYGFNFLPK